MRQILVPLLLLAALASWGLGVGRIDAEGEAPGLRAAVESALGELGVKTEDVRIKDVAFWKAYAPTLRERGALVGSFPLPSEHDPLRPPLVDRLLRRPLEAVAVGEALARGEAPGALRGVALGDLPPRAPSVGADPIPTDVDVPPSVRRLASLLAALEDATRAALPGEAPPEALTRWMQDGIEADEVEDARAVFERYRDTDLRPVLLKALALVEALRQMKVDVSLFPTAAPRRIETPRGLVVLGTPGKDVFEGEAWLLVDPGGDDVHRGNAGGTGPGLRAALCVEWGGDDTYESEAPFVQGSAHHGVGILFDREGDDTYTCKAFGQGAALGGVALLVDDGGKDRFDATDFAQGAAALGWGVLLSRGDGDDTYALDSQGQGFARTKGHGVLRDTGGNDAYTARKTHESMYSQWTGGRKVHWSFAQGCGLGFYCRYEGKRKDGKPGLVILDLLPGGVGALVDEAGNDAYRGSMYAQGTGYFQALGLCVDLGGDDTYEATWYGQGAAPHFAAGLLVDAAGNDRYTGMHQVQGNGRDFSTAVFLDLEGDDVYVAEDRVQGCGDIRDAYGIFVDLRGNDRYDSRRKAARGYATNDEASTMEGYANYGVFLDLEGQDVYEGKARGQNDATWIQENHRAIGKDGVRHISQPQGPAGQVKGPDPDG